VTLDLWPATRAIGVVRASALLRNDRRAVTRLDRIAYALREEAEYLAGCNAGLPIVRSNRPASGTIGWLLAHDVTVRAARERNGLTVPPRCTANHGAAS
jgi:hypothetical protein